ncbi:Cyanovirin-N [Chaetomium tenue]|uniref:Cyanovirin-N n=1 Tax=Chaetomium tenue TaxID=1854479 RepID=A0ACB7PMN1_9PEZI|nr:Cyanovirin-N [Chaetomium globosum]
MKISFLAVAVASLATQAAASYVNSCRNCRLEKWNNDWLSGDQWGPILLCDCKQTNGQWHASRLDLNNCIANDDGRLAPRQGGNLGGSCNMFSLDSNMKYFGAYCKKK